MPEAPTVDDSTPAAAGELFNPVSLGRMSQVIVDQIRMLVREGRLRPGDRLPSERELCERFAVSRVTIREALRMLEASGLVEVRVGARGGAFVTTPTREKVGAGLADLLSLSPLTASNVTEARMVIELGLIPLAVERATDTDLRELQELCEAGRRALDDGTYSMAMSAEFHVRLAATTHNPAIEMLVHSFHGPMLMSLQEAYVVAPLMGHVGVEEHLLLVEAIAQGDTAGACETMRTHVQRTADRVAHVS